MICSNLYETPTNKNMHSQRVNMAGAHYASISHLVSKLEFTMKNLDIADRRLVNCNEFVDQHFSVLSTARHIVMLHVNVEMNAEPLCLPCAPRVHLLMVVLMYLLSYRCTRETQ
jgi:hypothetical protein